MTNPNHTELHRLSNELVVTAARLIRDVRRNDLDVPTASTRLLSLIDELGSTTVGLLAERDRCSQPTMSGLVNRLVERGWAQRTPHPDDSRSTLVDLTPLGRQSLEGIRRTNADLISARIIASGHNLADLTTTVSLLRACVAQQADDPAEPTRSPAVGGTP